MAWVGITFIAGIILLVAAMIAAYLRGYKQGYKDGEEVSEVLKPLDNGETYESFNCGKD